MHHFSLLFFFLLLASCASEPAPAAEPPAPNPEPVAYRTEARLDSLGIELPQVGRPVANYVNAVQVGELLFLAGKGPTRTDGTYVTGKVGRDLTVEEGYAAARVVGLNQLAAMRDYLGSLDRVVRIVKVHGMVNCVEGFGDQPEVINGFSDLMVEVFGERGKHARAAVGMYALPRNIAVEIEVVVQVRPE
jgi:enamine deaminase RidA (YjgF/YER057c/UK114 family)